MVRVKICGITNLKDALAAVSCGAWALGFIFYRGSRRFISPSEAKKIIEQIPPFVTPVGVFVNEREEEVKRVAEFCRIRTLQFHGDESSHYCQGFSTEYQVIKAVRVSKEISLKDLKNFAVSAFLFDSHQEGSFGGSGKTFSWESLAGIERLKRPWILSGGLNSKNVRQAILKTKPYAIDVASGVERAAGQKSPKLLQDFFKEIRRAER
ncbi:MAG: phosphoribosylanthranilate isomerase [Candidatus Omnitrophica bacterium]|nr:phosphoribosylanthranilate isomerase [Candidatus Omnitrophota bacterium]